MKASKIKKRIDWAFTLASMNIEESIEMSGIDNINNARRAANYQKSNGAGSWSVTIADTEKSKFKITRLL